MIINSSGISKSELTDYLGFWTTKLREIYNNDFVIRKEGVVDNIATAGSLTCMALEDVMLYLTKQMNPYTAEGEFQDALYSIVGLQRQYATYTVTTRTIAGTANTVCPVGSVRFKNAATEDIFELNTEVTIGAGGTVVGSFTAIELGSIELDSSASLTLIDAPDNISAVYYAVGNTTTVGDDYEDDSEFRARWVLTNSVKEESNSSGGLFSSLLPLVDNNEKNLAILQNRTGSTDVTTSVPAHSVHIILKSSESNNTIAKKILDHITDGVGMYGAITVNLQDSQNTTVPISFSRATEVPIYFNVEAQLLENYTENMVISKIKSAIIDNFNYSMGEIVVANDFYQYINTIEGIDYVTTLEVSIDGTNFSQRITIDYDEYSNVIPDNIDVSCIEVE